MPTLTVCEENNEENMQHNLEAHGRKYKRLFFGRTVVSENFINGGLTGIELERGWHDNHGNRHVWFWLGGALFADCQKDGYGETLGVTFDACVKVTKTRVGYCDQNEGKWVKNPKPVKTGPLGVWAAFHECFDTKAPVEPLVDMLSELLPNVMAAYELIVKYLEANP